MPAASPGEHRASACDSCGDHITLGTATCVTNAKQHLHSCAKPECLRKLEIRLGTAI